MGKKRFKKEDFVEDTPRFIAMDYEDTRGFYIFDTEKLDYVGFSNLYHDIHEIDKICDIINTIDYLLKERRE